MRARLPITAAGLLILWPSIVLASTPRENALWIEVTENGHHKATIAVTEDIARGLLECDDPGRCFVDNEDNDLITRELILSVLNGDEDVVEVQGDNGTELKLFMDDLKVPAGNGEGGTLVLETYRSGSCTFRMSLPEIQCEAMDDDGYETGSVTVNIGWKGLLPFLTRAGGAIYVDSDDDDTEVWVYVD